MRQRLVQLKNSLRAKLDRLISKRSGEASSFDDVDANAFDDATHVGGTPSPGAPPPPPDIASVLGTDVRANTSASRKPTSPPVIEEFEEPALPGEKKRRIGVDMGIVIVALGALAASIFFFFGDGFFSSGQHGDMQPVGHLTKSHNDVRRKVDGGLSWGTVASADKVYEGDSVFTGDGSDAVIELDKGGRIAVDPKSLIVIRTKGSNLEVDLQYGSLEGHVENNQPLLLKQGNEVKKIESKNAQIRIVRAEKSHKTSIQVLSGELKVQNKIVAKNEVVELEKDEAPVVTKVRLSLLAPASDKTLWLPAGKTVDFTWKTDKPDAKYTLELSHSTSFEHPIYNATVQGTSYQLAEESRPAGDFYWRVRPAGEGLPSLPSRLTVYSDVPPKLVAPADNYVFSTPTESPTIELPLSWEDTAGSTQYNVQIATDEEFQKIILDEKTKLQRFKSHPLAQGQYHWRVMGMNPDRNEAPWSRSASFTISPAAKPIAAPTLTQATLKYVIPQAAVKGLIGPIPEEQGIRANGIQPLAWAAVADATEYQVEQANNPQFKNASTHEVTESKFTPDEVRPGDFYMRVHAKDKNGRVSEASEVAHLEVTVQPPLLNKIKDQALTFASTEAMQNDHSKREFKLTWTPQPFAEGYEVEWGADREFTRSKTFRTKESAKAISVSRPMPYAARVRSLDKLGNPISPYSETIQAEFKKVVSLPKTLPPKRQIAALPPKLIPVVKEVTVAPPLVVDAPPERSKSVAKVAGMTQLKMIAPVLREPLPQSSLISLESTPTFVNFKWKPVKGVNFYILEIAQDADFENKIAEVKVQATSFVFQKPLPEGHVFWRVRYQKGRSESDWSDVSDLNVIYQ